jgi:aspartate racemase
MQAETSDLPVHPTRPATVERSAPSVVRIEQRLYAEMLELLIDALPFEGCGLIAFDGDTPVQIYPGTNILRSAARYRMSDVQVVRASDDMDEHGWWLGAIYHSHPTSPPVPSTTDLREANWPDALMIIISLVGDTPEVRAYRVGEDRHSYAEVAIEIYAERLPWLSSLRRHGIQRVLRVPTRATPRRPVLQPAVVERSFASASGSEQAAGVPLVDAAVAPALLDEPERRATIGILGGMGPLATADLYVKIVELTPAAIDQEHIPVVIWADPRVPDRTAALLGEGEDPTPWLVHGARQLAALGADFIVMPCNTAHAFLDDVQPAVERPIISMIDAAADEIRRAYPRATTIGLLATGGTIASEIYQRALQARGLETIVPDDDIQRRCVMGGIREVKAGRTGKHATALLAEAGEHLAERGTDVLLAACTEIPVVFQQRHTATPLVDATAALARIAVDTARHLDEAERAGAPQWETSTSGWPAIGNGLPRP